MKTYDQLTEVQKQEAFRRRLEDVLTLLADGALRFNDEENGDDLQKRIDAAFRKANAMHTPWFIGNYILDTCSKEINDEVKCEIEKAIYPEKGELFITGIA
jgi:uncharacterized protein (DUF1697 family)